MALLGIAACGFSGQPLTPGGDGGAVDAPPMHIDACTIGPVGLGAPAAANLGEQVVPPATFMHGVVQPPITCVPGELPIGIGTYTTMKPVVEGGNERVVRSMTIRCGTAAFDGTGQMTITPKETIQTPYGGCMPDWGVMPATDVIKAPPATCPVGELPVGLTANGGTGSLFNTLAVACAPVSPSGSVAAVAESIGVFDSGTYTNNPQAAPCPANTALVSYSWRGNCGVDELTPVCAALSCH